MEYDTRKPNNPEIIVNNLYHRILVMRNPKLLQSAHKLFLLAGRFCQIFALPFGYSRRRSQALSADRIDASDYQSDTCFPIPDQDLPDGGHEPTPKLSHCPSQSRYLSSPTLPTFPLEIQWVVLDLLLNESIRSRATLGFAKSYSLVSRGWYVRCAPVLYSHLKVQSSLGQRPDGLIRCLRRPDSPLGRYAVRVSICAGHTLLEPVVMAQLARLLPNVEDLQCDGVDWRRVSYEDGWWYRVLAVSVAGFASLARLELSRCLFLSIVDLIHLLAALPAVSSVVLQNIGWTSRVGEILPLKKCNRLSSISLHSDQVAFRPYHDILWFLLLSDPPGMDGKHSYPGLHIEDARTLIDICGWTMSSVLGLEVELTASLYHKTWVITIHDYIRNRWIEVYVCSTNANATGYIRWIVFRFQFYDEHEWRHVGRLLARFPRLKKVVWELYDLDGMDIAHPQPPIYLGVISYILQSWTCQDAREYALKARKEGIPARNRLPISPLYLENLQA